MTYYLSMPTFGIHKDAKLLALFEERPWQGQNPEQATVFFVSLDANFPRDFHKNRRYKGDQGEYEKYGWYKQHTIEEWMQNQILNPEGLHHPFARPGCKVKGGPPYHRGIRSLGIEGLETKICFLELLKKPTWGSSQGNKDSRNLFNDKVLHPENQTHLNNVKNWIIGKKAFFSCGMYRLLVEDLHGVFDAFSLRRISPQNSHFVVNHPSRFNQTPKEKELISNELHVAN